LIWGGGIRGILGDWERIAGWGRNRKREKLDSEPDRNLSKSAERKIDG
jgi:hypothetical protein